ncbi:MAG: type I restriction enzyme HsdR N-terminal domain-containing protein [Campylobacteraceae bacterium]|jgi:hypothetical protein|nr:type I restriction enzyme HsdR N-terminal domain-containing protein [Campylobacteraceae bacterium]
MVDFKDQIKLLGDRVAKLRDKVSTEEATKTALIMPFIKELGYDIFNPSEVIPEFVADIGVKQGEKIDYAILKDNEPILLIECKAAGNDLNIKNESQLFRYFNAAKAKFAILTNGIDYRFFTDLVEKNKMDEKPFFSFDITQIKDNQIDELKKFHKSYFDFDNIVNTASELKYTNELKQLINSEIANPTPEFVKHFARQIYQGQIHPKMLEKFTGLVKKSFQQQLNDIVTDRLQTALNKETAEQQKIKEAEIEETKNDSKVVTTQEELDAFYIIRAILCSKVKLDRIAHRDAQSYFAILFDDNNRKTICRLYLTDKRKQIGIFDTDKKEVKFELETIESIYVYADKLLAIAEFYGKA